MLALALFLGAIAWALLLGQKLPPPPLDAARVASDVAIGGPADVDRDGLADADEDAFLARFSPRALLAPNDPSHPASVSWLRTRQELSLDGPRLFGTLVPGRRFDDETRRGSTRPADWAVYGHAYPTAEGGINLQYWYYYPYNDGPFILDHESDWEHVTVELAADGTPTALALARHDHNAPGFRVPWVEVPTEDGHPWFVVASGTHAAYLDADDAPFWERLTDCPRDPQGRPQLTNCQAIVFRAGPGEASRLENVGERSAPRLDSDTDGFFMRYSGLWGEAAVLSLGSAAPSGPPFQRGFCVDARPGHCR